MTKFLLVIDMQEDFFQQGRLAEKRTEFTRSLNELVHAFRRKETSAPITTFIILCIR